MKKIFLYFCRMNLEDSIGYGHMSLGELTAIVQRNMYAAHNMGLRLRYYFSGAVVCGVIEREKAVLFYREYKTGFLHVRIAEMHADWRRFLAGEERKRTAAERRIREAEAREERERAKLTLEDRAQVIGKLGVKVQE